MLLDLKKLADEAINKARNDDKPGIVLATYSNVIFNGPYYTEHGFKKLNSHEFGPNLHQLALDDEKKWGHFSSRVIMARFFSDE